MSSLKLYKHQQEAVDFMTNRPGGAIFHEIGTGKTITALSIFAEHKKNNPDLKCLVVCPISLIESAWREDNQRFKFWFCNLHDDYNEQAELFCINYEYTRTKKRIMIEALIRKYPFICILDESHKLQNHKTITTKELFRIRSLFQARYIMTGTPVTNNELSLWGQMNFAIPGCLHDSFYAFRNTFFHLQRGGQIAEHVHPSMLGEMFKKGWKYQITKMNRDRLFSIIKKYSVFAKREDCLDLPDQVFENRIIEMTSSQRKIYKDMERHLVAEIDGKDIAVNVVLAKLLKLRQITSGFMYDEFGNVLETDNPKLDELLDVIEETEGQIIIWANFKHEIQLIQKVLPDSVTMYSETEDQDESVRKFKAGGVRFMIANPQSLGHGHTLTNCSIQVFYSLNYSFTLYDQACGRTSRMGATQKSVYIHLLCRESIDELILQVIQRKQLGDELIKNFLRRK